jgi:hypothetical protein
MTTPKLIVPTFCGLHNVYVVLDGECALVVKMDVCRRSRAGG